MALAARTKLGPYEVVSPLGAGGMGEVYRARDTRLGRDVAVKVLPDSFAADADRLLRFEQEARVLGTLSHPNLLAIYDVGTQGEIHYLVSEYLDGETLRERLSADPLSQHKVIEYAQQIANGLAAAHDKGSVHRDLKPENILVTRDGRVKILDFGLAKQSPDTASLSEGTASLTGPALTAPGTVMGTAGYMSPEQVRGQATDNRSDIFTFGAVLYEMITRKRAFKGDSAIETMNAILKGEPPEIDVDQTKISAGLERIVRHCLERNPADRFQSAHDLAFALGALSGRDTSSAVHAATMPRRRPWLAWGAIALAVAAVAAAAFLLGRRQSPLAERLEFAIPVNGEASHMALSPDGSVLAFVSPDEASGANMLSVQRIGSGAVTVLPGTEGASYPFWSPDDTYVAFFAEGKLKKVAASGGTPQTLAISAIPRGGSWGRRGVIIYAPDAADRLWRVNADGSNAAQLTDAIFDRTKEASHRWPVFLPDGDHFLFWAGNFQNSRDDTSSGVYFSSLDAKSKALVAVTRSNPGYSAGYLYYVDERKALLATSMDVSSGRVSGEPRVVAEGVGYQPSTYRGAFTAAENGSVVYNAGSGAVLSALTWVDRAGKELGRVGDPGVLANPTISPDGSRVAVNQTDVRANNVDIWIHDLKSGNRSRFTFDPAEEVSASWSRDGTTIAFYRSGVGEGDLLLKKAHGLEPEKYIRKGGGDPYPNSWTLDDQAILCSVQASAGASSLVLIPVSGKEETPFLDSPDSKTSLTNGQISPDGKWVAYASNESGDWEIYVTTFPGAVGKWQVSRGGGTEPRWRGDGKEIFYIGARGTLTAVPVSTEGTFSTGAATSLFQTRGRVPISSSDLVTYDVARDGQRFLVNRYVKPEHIQPLTILLHAAGTQQ